MARDLRVPANREMKNLGRILEITANVAIILAAVAVVTVAYREHLHPPIQTRAPINDISLGAPAPFSVPSAVADQKTLALVLNTHCHFCDESSLFFRRLSNALAPRKNVHLIALFPQPEDEARTYLKQKQIQISDVQQHALTSIPVVGTPTLLLLDSSGKVVQKWRGRLGPTEEETVWQSLGCRSPENCS